MKIIKKIYKLINFMFLYLTPKYHKYACLSLKYKWYIKFGDNSQVKFKDLNNKVCYSYFSFFNNIDSIDYFKPKNLLLDKCVFVYWDKGYDGMPNIVKECYKQLLETTKYKVILLTDENIKNYVNIPNEIYNLVKNGIITKTLFSDILRFCLLSEYDCIWLDSTVLLLKDFPNDIFDYPIYTINPGKEKSIFDNLPSLYFAPDLLIQQTYFLAGKNKSIFRKTFNLLISYFLTEPRVLSNVRPYYITYFAFEFLCSSDLDFIKSLNERPINNSFVERIEGTSDYAYFVHKDFYFGADTFLYKLSYKFDIKDFDVKQFLDYYKKEVLNHNG